MFRTASSNYRFINCSFTRIFVLKSKSADNALFISAITKPTTTTTTTITTKTTTTATTTTTTATTATTTTTATTAPTSTSTSMATVLHISTTTPTTKTTTITTTPTNTQTLPSSSFFLVSGWAIIAGTVGGLTTFVAIILVWWNCKPCCLCPVCVSRFVS